MLCVDCGTAYASNDDGRCYGCIAEAIQARWKLPGYRSMDFEEARDLGLDDLRDPFTRDLTDGQSPIKRTKEMFK